MLPVKLNLAKNVGGFSYRIKANSEDIPSVVWEPGRIAGDATDLLAHEGASERAAWQEASDWLRERLAAGPAPAKDLQGEALSSGLTRKSLWTASVRLGIVKSKSTFSGGWTWALPSVEGTKIPSGAEDFQDSTPGKVGILGAQGNLQGVEL